MQQNQNDLSNIFLEDPRKYFSIIGLDSKDYDSLSEKEKEAVKTVINESLIKNNDQVYDQLYLTDYDEIPVSFKEFISNDFYLGKSTRHGDAIYPFWQNEGEKIFAKNEINEVALSGSIGVGKTTSACIMMAYHLYKTMCLKNPQQFFNLTPGSVIAYAFINNTLESSKGVGFGTIQSFVKESDWFLKHGRIVGRSELEYQPDKGFGFVVGSKPQHTLGRHVICSLLDEVSFAPGQNVSYEKCLVGDTIIKTTNGNFKIEELENKTFNVLSFSLNSDVIISDECTVIKTMETHDLIEIELEDGFIIKCTPFHRLMLKDGTYKMAKDLSEEDELIDIEFKS